MVLHSKAYCMVVMCKIVRMAPVGLGTAIESGCDVEHGRECVRKAWLHGHGAGTVLYSSCILRSSPNRREVFGCSAQSYEQASTFHNHATRATPFKHSTRPTPMLA